MAIVLQPLLFENLELTDDLLCSLCRRLLPRTAFYVARREARGTQSSCKECQKPDCARRNREMRTRCIQAYGGSCACCGEDRYEFLALDHVNGGGNAHRRALKHQAHGRNFYLWLIRNEFPSDPPMRVLCHNCNMAIGLYGYCPHESRQEQQRSIPQIVTTSSLGNPAVDRDLFHEDQS